MGFTVLLESNWQKLLSRCASVPLADAKPAEPHAVRMSPVSA